MTGSRQQMIGTPCLRTTMVNFAFALELKHIILALTTIYAASKLVPRTPLRQKQVQPKDEHVLIVGASSGVGKELAKLYARRGARVCLVARGAEKLKEAERECLHEILGDRKEDRILAVVADAGNVEDMARVRETVLQGKRHPPIVVSCFNHFPNRRVGSFGHAGCRSWRVFSQAST